MSIPKRYEHIDFKPTMAMRKQAALGLDHRKKYGKGGTDVGVARARDIKNGVTLSPETWKRMHSFFSRHQGNKGGGPDDAGAIAWKLWSGDAGASRAKKIVNQMNTADAKKSVYKHCPPWVFNYLKVEKKPDYLPDYTCFTEAKIVKNNAQQIVYGIVLSPHTLGDSQGDVVAPHEIEKACYKYMRNSRVIKLQHLVPDEESYIVESWIEPYPSVEDRLNAYDMRPHKAFKRTFGNQEIASGDWLMGVKLSDDLWNAYQEGELTGFSIGGSGVRSEFSKSDFPEIQYIKYQ